MGKLALVLFTVSGIAVSLCFTKIFVRTPNFFDICIRWQTEPIPRLLSFIWVGASSALLLDLFLSWSSGLLSRTEESRVIQKMKNQILTMVFSFALADMRGLLSLYFGVSVLASGYAAGWFREKVSSFLTVTDLPSEKRHQNLFFGQLVILLAIMSTMLTSCRCLDIVALHHVLGGLITPALGIVRDIISHVVFLLDPDERGNSVRSYRVLFVAEVIVNVLELSVSLFFMGCLVIKSQLPIFYLRQLYENVTGAYNQYEKWRTWMRMRRVIEHLPVADEADLLREETCVICRLEMQIGEGRKLPCGHCFHSECIERWVGQQSSCPICKQDLKQALEEAERRLEAERSLNAEMQEPPDADDEPKVFRFEDLMEQ
jgi:E3 ubiquitin-protein ligase synoviolin